VLADAVLKLLFVVVAWLVLEEAVLATVKAALLFVRLLRRANLFTLFLSLALGVFFVVHELRNLLDDEILLLLVEEALQAVDKVGLANQVVDFDEDLE
jgi:hypothetical protein